MERRPLRTVLAFIEKNRSGNPFLFQAEYNCRSNTTSTSASFLSPYHQYTSLPSDHLLGLGIFFVVWLILYYHLVVKDSESSLLIHLPRPKRLPFFSRLRK